MPVTGGERAHYLHHENHPDDPGYRRFLSRLAGTLLERLPPGLGGLDYGCGPGPALAAMLREAGHKVAVYDPFFRPDPAPLRERYDLPAARQPSISMIGRRIDRFDRLLRPGGWLGLMTCFQHCARILELFHDGCLPFTTGAIAPWTRACRASASEAPG